MILTIEMINNYAQGLNNINTTKTYKSSLLKFHNFLNEIGIDEITNENINMIIHDYKAYLNQEGFKAVTINHHLIVVKTFLNDYTTIQINRKLKLLKTVKEQPHYLTIEQIHTALKYTTDMLDEIMIKLLSNTGLRIHEALSITIKQLNNTDAQGNAIIRIIGKNTKQRTIFIPASLVSQLLEYSQNNKRFVFESKMKKGRSLTTRTIEHRFKKLAIKIDEEEMTNVYSENLKPHNLRHSFAIHALKNNEINYVKEFLGHENITTTQIYTNLKEQEIIERFRQIETIE
ncbi:MAG: hypothetical protein E7Z85_04375 [Methanosphaera stadtmanae]|nr:hypothetical protein [Methanosphaera stadtmanae]